MGPAASRKGRGLPALHASRLPAAQRGRNQGKNPFLRLAVKQKCIAGEANFISGAGHSPWHELLFLCFQQGQPFGPFGHADAVSLSAADLCGASRVSPDFALCLPKALTDIVL